MLLVGLYEWNKSTLAAHSILTFMFKNIFITFEAEVLQIFLKKQSASAQKLDVLKKNVGQQNVGCGSGY